jgi:hypothetical protein
MSTDASPRRWRIVVLVAVVAVVAAGVGAGTVLVLGDRDASFASAGADPSASEASETAVGSSARTSSESGRGIVPDVVGLPLSRAESEILGAGLEAVVEEVLQETGTDNAVVAQEPGDGTRLAPGGTVTLTVARRAVGVYVADLEPVAYQGSSGAETATSNGTTYVHAITTHNACGSPVTLEYDLGRHYQVLRTTVGLTDDSATEAEMLFDLIVDGRPVFSQSTRLGAPLPVEVDLTGALRLEMTTSRIEADCQNSNRGTGVWADPQIFGAPGEVSASTAAPTG